MDANVTIYPCGTIAYIKSNGIRCEVINVIINFNNVKYEVSYWDDKVYVMATFYEVQLDFKDANKIEIGFKLNGYAIHDNK